MRYDELLIDLCCSLVTDLPYANIAELKAATLPTASSEVVNIEDVDRTPVERPEPEVEEVVFGAV